MTAEATPALRKFIAQLGEGVTLAQVAIRPEGRGYQLRHEADRPVAAEKLELLPVTGLRVLAQFTADGVFRPLKSAPNLRSGWRVFAANDAELGQALNQLYPGAIADWFAAQSEPVPVTHYRPFTERQTGMYRITTMLDDEQVIQVMTTCCAREFCLKCRLWTVGNLPADKVEGKSLIFCLEPCAILLESARKALRQAQRGEAGENGGEEGASTSSHP